MDHGDAKIDTRCFVVTGRAAHGRIGRLFRNLISSSNTSPCSVWIDKSPYAVTNDMIVDNHDGEDEGHHRQQQQESVGDYYDCITCGGGNTTCGGGNTGIANDHDHQPIAFLWENAPQYNTRDVRDTVSCYSHLPFGILLDDKWALARLLGANGGAAANKVTCDSSGGGSDDYHDAFNDPHLEILETYCFRGADFVKFAKRVGLLPKTSPLLDQRSYTNRATTLASGTASAPAANSNSSTATFIAALPSIADGATSTDHPKLLPRYQFEDLIRPTLKLLLPPPPSPDNLWVIKDAMSNGAGGIWIVDERNVQDFVLAESEQHQDASDVNHIDGNNHIQSNNVAVSTSNCAAAAEISSPVSAVPLHPTHRYVAQRYAWPPTLYKGRKCHIRVYALITCTGEAFVHRKAFLHVANELFDESLHEDCGGRISGRKKEFHPAVHITNCCANSHDASKFAGEICVDLGNTSEEYRHDDDNVRNIDGGDTTSKYSLPLGEYLPSISASVATLAQSFLPFLSGGEANGGFEYLGLDFVLSSVEEVGDVGNVDQPHESMGVNTSNVTCGQHIDMSFQSTVSKVESSRRRPVAYLLEVNAPPSQDTATGLQHAEDLHDEVISDLLRLWVMPNVDPTWSLNSRRSRDSTSTANVDDDNIDHRYCGGWRCVYPLNSISTNGGSHATIEKAEKSEMILPSKAAILNRIRWAFFEKKAMKESELMWSSDIGCNSNNNSDDQNSNDNCSYIYGGFDSSASNNNDADADDIDINGSGSSSSSGSRAQLPLTPPSLWSENVSCYLDGFVTFARSQFSYFSHNYPAIFFESGGGAQVPKVVQNAVTWSLSHRDRSVVGARLQTEARLALNSLLVREKTQPCREEDPSLDSQMIIMGTNATFLLAEVARRMQEHGMICPGDEIIISSENHQANVTPWLKTATLVGASVKWWTVAGDTNDRSKINDNIRSGQSSCILSDLVTDRTKVVAVSHVSNILGIERDISSICELIHRITRGRGQVVVDGVAAAPHLLESHATSARPDWYAVSLHKLFGPHLGCLICKRSAIKMLLHFENETVCGDNPLAGAGLPDEILARSWELGTMNYEACCGAIALHKYFVAIGINAWENGDGRVITHSSQPSYQITFESSKDHCGEAEAKLSTSNPNSFYVNIARMYIHHVENRLLGRLLGYLRSCAPNVRIVQDLGKMKVTIDSENSARQSPNLRRIPIVCFLHANIPSYRIVKHCRDHEVMCRACKFLSTDRLWNELGLESNADIIRFSLVHYNTMEELDRTIHILESLDGWN